MTLTRDLISVAVPGLNSIFEIVGVPLETRIGIKYAGLVDTRIIRGSTALDLLAGIRKALYPGIVSYFC